MSNSPKYKRMEKALAFIHSHAPQQPSLEDIASSVELSPFHFQRIFKRWVGVTPKRYLQNLTLSAAKAGLADSSVLDTTYDLGLSGPSRLHDLFVSLEALTPGEQAGEGKGLTIRYGVHWTPFGPCYIALTQRGICSLQFVAEVDPEFALAELQRLWPKATFEEDPEATAEIAHQVFHPGSWSDEKPFHLQLRGTNFQIQVWRALLQIPVGSTRSYSEVSEAIGKETRHARAVANAVGANPIAYLIPCHRVIRGSGALGGYRWGIETKERMLEIERCADS